MQAADVVKVATREDLTGALDHYYAQNIETVLVQEHIEGEVIKFYGVGPGEFFAAIRVSSGKTIAPQENKLRTRLLTVASRAAEAVGLEIYGGDAILTPDGQLVLIDVNDWPSFSSCRRTAAEHIAGYIIRMHESGFNGS
jgi:glutathione synthase/RimK-type ligase-like ATP-grasp enzyme